MARRQHHRAGLGEQWRRLEFGVVDGETGERAVDVAIAYAGRRIAEVKRAKLDPDVGVTTSEAREQRGEDAAGIVALLFGRLFSYGAAAQLPNNIEAFSITAAAGSFLIEAVDGVLAVPAFALIWKSSNGVTRLWRMTVAAVGLATPVLAYYGSLHPFPTYPNDRGIIFAGIAAALVVVWFVYLQLARPRNIAEAARHAEQHRGVPPLDEGLDYRAPEDQHQARPTVAG